MTPHFKNKEIGKLADDCGLTIEPLNDAVTDVEIEFFVEQVIKECAKVACNANHQDVGAQILLRFGLTK